MSSISKTYVAESVTFCRGGLATLLIVVCCPFIAVGQDYFNAWLTTCPHLEGPTGNPASLALAVDQSRGMISGAPEFSWDIQIDVGDWTASQAPPDHEKGRALAATINNTLGQDRGTFFTVSGNHDGEGKGWSPGEFTRKYMNPLGEEAFSETSGFMSSQRPDTKAYRQLLGYPGTRWDRYLVRTGNVIWIMLSDRNEFDTLAEQRGDTTGLYQAGRGSASGMPDGGYPSGSVTLETFEWWKKVVEDPDFSDDILITAHHLLPANTTITTDDGEPGDYHGQSGSLGPKGEVGGQLYWVREYNDQGDEIMQYAQTRPFLNYLRDHRGAIAAWVGGHTHIDSPESTINGRGIYVKKYGVTFLSVGALTDSHAGGANQMTRMLTFQDGTDEAVLNVYIHKSNDGHPIGWYEPAGRRIPLGKKFISPNVDKIPTRPYPNSNGDELPMVPDAPADPIRPRYYWNLNEDQHHDFNNETYVVGADGSPYGKYQGIDTPTYTEDSPMKAGRSLDLRGTNGRVQLSTPYQPEMNWSAMTVSLWLKTHSTTPQEVLSYSSASEQGKFRLWYDGSSWSWDVAEGENWKRARWKTQDINHDTRWHHVVAIIDDKNNRIQLFVDGNLVAQEKWLGAQLKAAPNHEFVIGASGDLSDDNVMTWSRPFDGIVDEVMIFDTVRSPGQVQDIPSNN